MEWSLRLLAGAVTVAVIGMSVGAIGMWVEFANDRSAADSWYFAAALITVLAFPLMFGAIFAMAVDVVREWREQRTES